MRRSVATAAAAFLAVSMAAPSMAQDKTLYVAAYGGSFEETMRSVIIPPFEKKHNVKIEYVAGNSTNNLARLQAQKGKQEIDVAILDDGPMYQAEALGFCSEIKPAPILDDIYDIARMGSKKIIGLGVVATGLTYNKKMFDENKWPAPTSWEDLKDPKFKKKLAIPPLNNTYGLHTLVMMARLRGGDEKKIEPGFKAMKDEVGPNVLVYEPSPGKMSELFQSGQIALAVWGSGRVKALADTGFPAEFVYPKEGAVALMVGACPVVDSDVPDLAQEFLRYMLAPETQVEMAKGAGFGPTNKKTVLPKELQAGLPYGPEQVAKLVAVDWVTVNQKRSEWDKRWTREIER